MQHQLTSAKGVLGPGVLLSIWFRFDLLSEIQSSVTSMELLISSIDSMLGTAITRFLVPPLCLSTCSSPYQTAMILGFMQ